MRRIFTLLLLCLGTTCASARVPLQIGIISYWGTDAAAYDRIPSGALALINPDKGVFVSNGQTLALLPNLTQYQDIVARASQRDVRMLGYVLALQLRLT